jgi:hypothetical protein
MRAHVAGSAERQKPALEPVPAAGFSGAAALDETGRLIGLVDLTAPAAIAGSGTQALLVTSEMIRAFLEREQVALAPSSPDRRGDFAGGIARVICTRR